MRFLALYLRSRYAPAALIAAVAVTVLLWSLWSAFSDSREVGPQMVVLTVLLLVAAMTVTLGGPDDALDRTAARPWRPWRAGHLLVAFLVVVGLPLASYATGAHFGPAALVVRDAAGLLGLTALGAAVAGTARSWFLPLGWTLVAVMFPRSDTLAARVLTWQAQPPVGLAVAGTALLLAAAGLLAYGRSGPARRPPAEAGQH